MNKKQIKAMLIDIVVDIIGGILMAIGLYCFAVSANFPVTGVSGIAVIFYKLFGAPIGIMTIVINIPVALMCYKILGKKFFVKSIKTMIITSVIIDLVAVWVPTYQGDPMLAAICAGVLSGLGVAMIYMRNSSTGGTDFIIMSVKALHPHLTIGKISFAIELFIIALAAATVFRNVDGIIYGLIINFLGAFVVDKVMYGMDAGKVALVVTQHGTKVGDKIDEVLERGSTLLKGTGSYSKDEKDVVMCACNNKEMYVLRKLIKEIDKDAFLVIMESNEVVGEGFKLD